jgi:hypothetical protein
MPSDQSGPHYTFQYIEFWAENGMVVVVDTQQAEKGVEGRRAKKLLRPGQFLAYAIGAYGSVCDRYPSEARDARKMFEHAVEVVKLAKHQGDALDPAVIEHHIKHEQPTRLFFAGQPEAKYALRRGDPRKQLLGEEPVYSKQSPGQLVTP